MSFVPPFCPNPACSEHHRTGEAQTDYPRWWLAHGSYRCAHSGEVLRLRCRLCRVSFSERTFSVHYATHRRIDSKRARTYHNPLFAVNYFDREIRKDMACHVRETVQWSREVNNAMDRMWLYAVWHNCFKPRRLNGTDARTHAEHAGVSEAVLGKLKRDFFTRRYFFTRISLSSSQWMSWLRAWATPQRRCGAPLAAYITA